MMYMYKEALDAARDSEKTTRGRLRGWAFVSEGNESLLVALSYVAKGEVDAAVIWQGTGVNVELEMVASFMNDSVGVGPAIVSALHNVYRTKSLLGMGFGGTQEGRVIH